jgi:hypothetical protein
VSLERHVGVTVFNPDVLAFNIAKIAKAPLECLHENPGRRRRSKKPDGVNIPCRLCLNGELRNDEAEGKGDGERSTSALHAAILRHDTKSLKPARRKAPPL